MERQLRVKSKAALRRKALVKAAKQSWKRSKQAKHQMISTTNTGPFQAAFQRGYPEFVDAPVKRIESSWRKICDSLGSMEKKLKQVTG